MERCEKQKYILGHDYESSEAQVFPSVVIATPAMLMTTEITLTAFTESSPSIALIKRVKNPEVEDNNVVLATSVRANAAF